MISWVVLEYMFHFQCAICLSIIRLFKHFLMEHCPVHWMVSLYIIHLFLSSRFRKLEYRINELDNLDRINFRFKEHFLHKRIHKSECPLIICCRQCPLLACFAWCFDRCKGIGGARLLECLVIRELTVLWRY